MRTTKYHKKNEWSVGRGNIGVKEILPKNVIFRKMKMFFIKKPYRQNHNNLWSVRLRFYITAGFIIEETLVSSSLGPNQL